MTDNDMRHIFIGYQVQVLDADPEEASAEFDRWLAAHDAEIREQAAQKVEVLAGYAEEYLSRSALYIAAAAIRGAEMRNPAGP